MIPVKVKTDFKHDKGLPAYQTSGSAGCDVHANAAASISPGESSVIPTGIYPEIPQGYEIQVRSRSGLAASRLVSVLNAPGTIDSDYRDEIKIILYNSGHTTFKVTPGDRIAQLVIAPVVQIKWVETDERTQTERTGGLGSTGV
jgi:dUTP pyrophosphatase